MAAHPRTEDDHEPPHHATRVCRVVAPGQSNGRRRGPQRGAAGPFDRFEQLKPWIDCLHAKDRKLHVDRGVPAGQGDLDYRKFVTLAAKHTPQAPLILEYVGPTDYRAALAHLRTAMRQAGVAER